jgi:aspartate ammonia-lyase
MDLRTESDLLGSREVPAQSLWGIHTLRAVENFPLSGRKIHPELIKAYGSVKHACFRTNLQLGFFRMKLKPQHSTRLAAK